MSNPRLKAGKDCHDGGTVRRPSNTCDALTNTTKPAAAAPLPTTPAPALSQ